MSPPRMQASRQADIALLLEGTYPYVSGGVSSWVASMLKAFPHHTFAIVFIGGRASDYDEMRFTLPDNVIHFESLFLFDNDDTVPMAEAAPWPEDAVARMSRLHDQFSLNDGKCGDRFREILPLVFPGGPITEQGFLHGQQSWRETMLRYHERCTDPSFTDYFWTVRIMHIPVWKLIRLADRLPPVKMCHTVSTGYAGFLGALLHYRRNVPLLVSEHGIYTKERQIDLFQSQWIRDNRALLERDAMTVSYFQELWIRFFRTLGTLAYDAAHTVIALYEGNRQRQIADGASPGRTRLIPNGIDVERLLDARRHRPAVIPKMAVLIGRIVPIKDINTFIRAVFIGRGTHPELQACIVGPQDEDPDYVQKCRDMIAALGLENSVQLFGFRDVREILQQAGVLVLSSISEGQPLVVLEAFAAGVPAITTDVGACRELIEGAGAQDAAIGKAGRVVPMADPDRLARAMLDVLFDAKAWKEAQDAAIERVERYYTRRQMVDAYQGIYNQLLNSAATAPDNGAPAWRA